jgi:WD40 repeat protein
MNVRAGPGTEYALAGTAEANQPLQIVGRNADATWLQVCCVAGKQVWVSASLVTVQGDTARVPVPADLPTPAPQPTAAPRAASGSASGVLLYSIANMDKKRWELWEYSFATKQSRFLKEWMTEVAFSRDYKQVAYFSWGPATDNKPGICLANADLSNQRLIFVGAPSYPSFSPDGKRLAVQGDDEFYIMNSDGAGLHQVDLGEYPAWSPIDNWIAHRGCYGPDCGLWLTHADSGERRRLTKGGGDGQPAWSPDGKQLAYISKDDGNFEVYKVNRDGSERVRLTNDIHSDGLPVWSPDGSWIAFRSDRSGTWAIYVMRPDGTGVIKLVDANVPPVWFYEKMAWRP